MEADGVLPGPERPALDEIAHECGRTRITRLALPEGTVIRKEPLGPDGERRVRHEVALLGVPPDAGDPLTAQTRVQRACAAALRAVASRKRPFVLFLDDLQWAGGTPLGFVDLVLSEDRVDGLLLVGAYREGDVDAAHPLAAPLSRWLDQATMRRLRLVNLPGPDLAAMVAEMLRVGPPAAAGLAEVIEPYTRGNPYETVELVNALRRDGLLTATAAGWRSDQAAVRAHLGRSELAQAREEYLAWGATAKVGQLDWAYPALRAPAEAIASDDGQSGDHPPDRAVITTGTIDLVGIVSASQALSSETSIGRLPARVVQVLSAMTGATGVRLLLRSEDRDGWLLPAPDGGGTVPVSDTDHDRAAPMSVLRYAKRMREPLVVADAARDDRFARDPYFDGVDCCSLLAVPILSRGALRAVLLLENRLLGGAFTAGRLDAVELVAGQLAVSLDNAQLYAGFREIADEQAALRRVATLVARGAAPEQVFAAVTEELARLVRVDAAAMARYEPDGTLIYVASWGSAADFIPVGSRWTLDGKNVATAVFETGRPARVESQAGATGSLADLIREMGVRSMVSTAVVVEGRLWGSMEAGSTLEEPLVPDAEARLASFTELVATAIANAESRAALARVADEQAALRRVATLVARSAPPQEVLTAVTEEAGRLLHAHHAWMGRNDPGGARTVAASWSSTGDAVPVGSRAGHWGQNLFMRIFRTGQPARIDGYADTTGPAAGVAQEIGFGAAVGAPISVEGRLWGIMVVVSEREPLPTGTEARLARFTELAATGIANAQAQAEVAASRARIVAAADETRRRIERDLHDGVQQRLVTEALMLSGIRDRVPADVRADVDEARDELAATRQELRDLCQGVHPALLVEVGLGAAIRALARRSPLPVRVQMQTEGRLPGSCEVTAYYVAAEAFTNAAKHASASAVDILIEEADGTLTVQVRDDGVGGADASRGSGLTGLRDRVEAVGGRMTLVSTAGAGTVLTVLLPVTADDH
jgi:signal transduction histidine kinase